jgi:hypothetical protein
MTPVTPDEPRRSGRTEGGAADPVTDKIEPTDAPRRPIGRPPTPRTGSDPRRTPRPPRSGPDPGPPARSGRDSRSARPRPAAGPRAPKRAPLMVAAAVNATWAALVSFLPVALVMGLAQLAEDAATVGGAARIGLAGWLLGHGVPLQTGAGPLGLPPLALAVLAAWRVARAGVHTSRAIGARHRGSPRQALSVAGAVGLGYGVLGAGAAVIVSTGGGPDVPVLRAGLTLTVFGALAALIGALRTTGALGVVARRTPPVLRDGLRTGVVAALLMLGAGAGAAGLAVATGGGEASDMIGAYRTGVAGQAGITLVSVAYTPNAAVWSASYLLGPGFAVGTDTAVRTSDVSLGALPAVPLLAGLPHGPVGGLGDALLTVPVLAAMGAGWLFARRALRAAVREREAVGWVRLLGAAAVGGPVAGAMLGLAALFSGGPLGGGRLAEIGPVGWQVAAMATLVVAAGSMVGAAATRAMVHP